ncbi:MAG: right-handed parallel beta-helix repeat-containing protein [Xenococcaceae cyanobacterium MO_188.B29]|nr:right-handed parallel beta-helix repeat-containing protein [Xenococcaceae cyanobacterium MO_188.B29]
MNRRTFLTWIGLGWLASASPIVIGACIAQDREQLVSASPANSLEAILFYVAPNGNDDWSGKQKKANWTKTDGPFPTLHRARDAIRQLKNQQGGNLKQPVTVLVRGGTYFLPEPLVLTPEDSGTADFPVAYKAYPNEKPIISGGRPINSWRRQGNLWVANLPEVKAGKWYFRLLRVRNDWAIRARYPNFDPKNPLRGGWLFARKDKSTRPGLQFGKDYVVVDPEQFPNWQNWEGAELQAFMGKNWSNSILPVTRVNKENYTLLGNFQNASGYRVALGNRFFIENVREALDSPGEWYLDAKTGELFYWPTTPDFPNSVEVVAPAMNSLIVLQGDGKKKSFVENIHFQSLTFTDTDYTLTDNYSSPADAAIWLSTARHCGIEDCTFVRLGGYGLRIEQHSHENRIIRNRVSQLGQGGVILLGDKATQPFNNLIAANDIHDCSKVYKNASGVDISSGSGNRIAHNQIYRMPRKGILLRSDNISSYSHKNIVEFNEIVDTNLETSDTGAIATLGRDKQASGNIIRFNFIRNVVGIGTTARGKILSPHFTWGIYLDDYSSGTTVYGNIVVGTVLGAICIHAGKDNRIENNIFINGSEMQIRLQPRDKFMAGNIFRRNIVIYKNPKAILWYSYQDRWQRDCLKDCDRNLYWHTGGLNLEKTKRAITPEGTFNQWQAAGFDIQSLITEPPFLTPLKLNIDRITQEDFKLDRDSDIVKQLGLKQIPIERIGIEGFQA